VVSTCCQKKKKKEYMISLWLILIQVFVYAVSSSCIAPSKR
jgi:hypothetical protein